jgi:hypothetical protein
MVRARVLLIAGVTIAACGGSAGTTTDAAKTTDAFEAVAAGLPVAVWTGAFDLSAPSGSVVIDASPVVMGCGST